MHEILPEDCSPGTPTIRPGCPRSARSGTATHVERLVRLYRRCERQQEDAKALEQVRTRSFRYRKLADGSLRFEGQLPPEAAAVFLKAMEAARDAMREGARDEFPAGSEPAAPAAAATAPAVTPAPQPGRPSELPAGNLGAFREG